MSDLPLPPRRATLSADTTVEIEDRQIAAWRRMSPAEKLQVVRDATRAVTELALAGIRHRYPNASDRECFLRLSHKGDRPISFVWRLHRPMPAGMFRESKAAAG